MSYYLKKKAFEALLDLDEEIQDLLGRNQFGLKAPNHSVFPKLTLFCLRFLWCKAMEKSIFTTKKTIHS